MAGGRRFSWMAAALLALGGGWAGSEVLAAWNEADRAGYTVDPAAEGYFLAGEVPREAGTAEVWLRSSEPSSGGQWLSYWVVLEDSSCSEGMATPDYAVWEIDRHVASCDPIDGSGRGGDRVVLTLVPRETESGAFTDPGGERFAMTVINTPDDWDFMAGVAVLEDSADPSGGGPFAIEDVHLEPPAPQGLFMSPPLPAETPDARAAIDALGRRGIPLATARVGDELLTFYLNGYSCGLLATRHDDEEIYLVAPLAPGEEGDGTTLPGGPYKWVMDGTANGPELEIHCGLREMVVQYLPAEPGATVRETTGPITVVAEPGSLGGPVFAIGAEERRAPIADYFAEQQEWEAG
jgi:hypothetical protein